MRPYGIFMKRKYIIALITVSLVLLIDQYTKWLVRMRMVENEGIPILPKFFSLQYLTNPGAAFGLFTRMDERFRGVFFLIVGAVAMTLVIYYLIMSDDRKIIFPISLALVMGGAMGNIIDRIRFGHVTDFLLVEATFLGNGVVTLLDRYLGGHYWPSFNVSDSTIVIGIFGMAIDLLFFTKEESQQGVRVDSEQNIVDSGQ